VRSKEGESGNAIKELNLPLPEGIRSKNVKGDRELT